MKKLNRTQNEELAQKYLRGISDQVVANEGFQDSRSSYTVCPDGIAKIQLRSYIAQIDDGNETFYFGLVRVDGSSSNGPMKPMLLPVCGIKCFKGTEKEREMNEFKQTLADDLQGRFMAIANN